MHIQYLGTGASEGFPGVFCQCPACVDARTQGGRNIRRRSSALVDGVLLIDLSPDVCTQFTQWNVDVGRIAHLLVTHTHHDHFYTTELTHLRPPYCLGPEREKLTILGHIKVMQRMEEVLGAEELAKLRPHFEFVELSPFVPQTVGNYVVTPLKARHSEGSYIYILESKGKTFLYANDTGFFPEETWDFLANKHMDAVSMDCTHPLRIETPSHMSLEDNITTKRRLFQQKSASAQTKFLATHFSHMSGLLHRPTEERLRLYGITAAYDGYVLEI